MRRAAAVDANQSEIVEAFRRLGCTVEPLHAVGRGVPDLLCGYKGVNRLVEIKDGAKVPSARKLTPAQVDWHRDWRGEVFIAETTGDAIRLVRQWNEAGAVALEVRR